MLRLMKATSDCDEDVVTMSKPTDYTLGKYQVSNNAYALGLKLDSLFKVTYANF
jgi:hypothetical protein